MLQAAHEQPLLLDLYGCCTGRTQWAFVLEKICKQFECKHFMVQKLSFEGPRLAGGLRFSSDASATSLYDLHISDAHNPRLERKRLGERARGKVVIDEQLFDAHEQTEKQFFLDRLSGLGVRDFMGGLTPLSNENSYLGIALHRSTQDTRLFTSAEQAQLQALLPHLGQSFLMWEQLNTRSPLEAILKAQADHYPFGIAICDSRSRLRWMNSLAEKLLPPTRGARHINHVLKGWTAQQTETLQRLVATARPDSPTGYVALKNGTNADIHIAIKPFKESESGETFSLLILSSTSMVNDIPFEALQTLFGLTQAEARLTSHLACGGTLEAYAAKQEIALTTVRWHVKQILSKTESGRQAELVQKILCSVAYLASKSSDLLPL
ncbi:helix-turn-helix transcriptional regulator [Pseudomonas sp. CES]|uniref:helix-turn-helix transcriptional regulator n=1 Tax=Pseudomonas sp. CES TaxID=2719586 RepID=UPI00146FD468|nr:helix-turn-helix transcriptional regulator [Pseudomonas sp. CES]KAF4558101.1 helix-turn-helix transcriptional regulator [Pseudomonas sp. CES]